MASETLARNMHHIALYGTSQQCIVPISSTSASILAVVQLETHVTFLVNRRLPGTCIVSDHNGTNADLHTTDISNALVMCKYYQD